MWKPLFVKKIWGPGPLLFFSITFSCIAMPYYVCPYKTSLYELQRVLLHFEQYLRYDQ